MQNPLNKGALWEALAPITTRSEARARLDNHLSQLGQETNIDGLLQALADAEVDLATSAYKIGFLHGAEIVADLPKQ